MQITSIFPFAALSLWFEQLADLLNSGINLNRALMILHDLEPHPKRKIIISDIIEQIRTGKDLSEALSMHPETFSKTISELIRAGENSGNLKSV